jgi:hypothetical protein
MCKLTIWLVVSCVALWVRIAMMLTCTSTCMQLVLNECRAKSTFDKKNLDVHACRVTGNNTSESIAVPAGAGVARGPWPCRTCWARSRCRWVWVWSLLDSDQSLQMVPPVHDTAATTAPRLPHQRPSSSKRGNQEPFTRSRNLTPKQTPVRWTWTSPHGKMLIYR